MGMVQNIAGNCGQRPREVHQEERYIVLFLKTLIHLATRYYAGTAIVADNSMAAYAHIKK
jgi:hypothetical protein